MTSSEDRRWAVARQLVVGEGRSYAEAAQTAGVPLSTLQKRASRDQWQAQRDQSLSYEGQVRSIKAQLAQRALDALADPKADLAGLAQLVYALKTAEAAFPELKFLGGNKEDPQVRRQAALDVFQQLVEYLAERDPAALRALQPHIAPFTDHLETAHAA